MAEHDLPSANGRLCFNTFVHTSAVCFWQVALGRLALEPLAVLASLCHSDGKEILSLNLHALQSHVPQTELLKAAERCLMTVVAQVNTQLLIVLQYRECLGRMNKPLHVKQDLCTLNPRHIHQQLQTTAALVLRFPAMAWSSPTCSPTTYEEDVLSMINIVVGLLC